MTGKRRIQRAEALEDLQLDEATARKVDEMIEQAERDIAMLNPVRVSFRWGREPLSLVKRAAALRGVPHVTYLKDAALRQALTDLRNPDEAGDPR